MTVAHTMTADQLLARAHELGRCELIQGELNKMSPAGGKHGAIAVKFAFHLQLWANEHGGLVTAAETGFVLERDPDTVRAPDAAYIAADRAEQARTPKFIPIPPDVLVEVLSPHDKAEQVDQKVQWWLDHGVKLIWVADPANRSVTAYYPGGRAHVYRGDDPLPGGQVLPGLEVQLRQLFD